MGHHLTKRGTFKSDKYRWCKEGFFALKFTDSLAWEVILLYASFTRDKGLAKDLRKAVVNAGGPDETGIPRDGRNRYM